MTPNDSVSLDQQISSLLAACDEALAAGATPSLRFGETVSDDVKERMTRGLRALRLLRGGLRAAGPFPPAAAAAGEGASADGPFSRLGRFVIRRELGRGGFGLVFLAFDPRLGREVALKVPRPEALVSEELRQRFVREARAAAALDHPNLVPVYEAGEVGPVCYIASAYCPGTTLAAWLKERTEPVAFRWAAALVATLAEAVAHAHGRGVVHRDLKPSNVMLEPLPDAAPPGGEEALGFVPRVADFGLAKVLTDEDAGQTQTGAVMGTPSYMAPEQAGGKSREVGPAADVYALGAILYELLTGQPPVRGETVLDALEQLRNQEPAPPTRLRPRCPRDLETVCLKCLDKEPQKRYATAQELAGDLRRFLADEAIHARPASAGERAVRWVRRRPAAALVSAVVGAAVVALLAVWAGFTRELQVQKDEAVHQQEVAIQERNQARAEHQAGRRILYAAHLKLAQEAWRDAAVGRMLGFLDGPGCRPAGDDDPDLRGWEWYYLKGLTRRDLRTLRGTGLTIPRVAFSPDGRFLAAADHGGLAHLWDASTGKEVRSFKHLDRSWVLSVAFSPDGRELVTAGWDGVARVWDVATGEQTSYFHGPKTQIINSACYSPDGKYLAWVEWEDNTVHLWDRQGRREALALRASDDHVKQVAFSPDSKLLATAGLDAKVRLWDVPGGGLRQTLSGHGRQVSGVAFSPDGKWLATSSEDWTAKLWEVDTGRERFTLKGHTAWAYDVAFSPDGRLVATGGHDQTVRLWDPATGALLTTLGGHTAAVLGVAFSPDGARLASSDDGGAVKFWEAAPRRQEYRTLAKGTVEPVYDVAYSGDGRLLAGGDRDRAVRVWDPRTGRLLRTLTGHAGIVTRVCFRPGSPQVASAGADGTARLWDADEGRLVRTFAGHTGPVRAVAFRPDGGLLASCGADATVRLWDPDDGRLLRTLPGEKGVLHAVAFSPDGGLLAAAGEDGTVAVWDAGDGRRRLTLRGHRGAAWQVAFSPDGRRLASLGQTDGTVKLWDVAGGAEIAAFRGDARTAHGLAFSPDGWRLAVASDDYVIRIWAPDAGQELLALTGPRGLFYGVAFSPRGDQLASCGGPDGTVQLWDAPRRDGEGADLGDSTRAAP